MLLCPLDCVGCPLLCGFFSSYSVLGLSLVAEPALLIAVISFAEVPGLEGTSSAVEALGLSCSLARGIFPDQG